MSEEWMEKQSPQKAKIFPRKTLPFLIPINYLDVKPASRTTSLTLHVALMKDFLPAPVVGIVDEGSDEEPPLYGYVTPKKSIGRLKAFNGQFGMFVRAYTYIRVHGASGLRANSELAVLNANYVLSKLKGAYVLPYDRVCMHEFVLEGHWSDAPDVHALDISKRLMDFGIHPPTNYFPLIVKEALMIEPTETESRETLDAFAAAMLAIAKEAKENPEMVRQAPHTRPVKRLDEVRAAKEPVLNCCGVTAPPRE